MYQCSFSGKHSQILSLYTSHNHLGNCNEYVGKGNKSVTFSSTSPENPAQYYLNSTPAHTVYPNKKIGINDVETIELGAPETVNTV